MTIAVATSSRSAGSSCRSPGKYDDLTERKTKPTTSRDLAKGSSNSTATSGTEEDPSGGGKTWSGIPDVPGGTGAVTQAKEVEPVIKPPKTHTLTIYNGETVTKAIYTEGEQQGGESRTQIERTQQPDQPAPKASKPEADSKPAAPGKPGAAKTETK